MKTHPFLLSLQLCAVAAASLLFASTETMAVGTAAPVAAASASASASTDTTIPADRLLQPAELDQMLKSTAAAKPLVLQVGSAVLYAEAHIPGSEYAGPAGKDAGLQALRDRTKSLGHDQFIVIYCGCCPWEKCPNIRNAFRELTSLGFTNVKAMYVAHDFGTDWVAKGYPVEKGH